MINIQKLLDTKRKRRIFACLMVCALAFGLCLLASHPAWAMNQASKDTVKGITTSIIGIIGTIFQVVGVILTAFAVGQLVLAFKNEDADSKARATTMMVVGLVLIAIPTIISGLGLVDKIT